MIKNTARSAAVFQFENRNCAPHAQKNRESVYLLLPVFFDYGNRMIGTFGADCKLLANGRETATDQILKNVHAVKIHRKLTSSIGKVAPFFVGHEIGTI